MQNQNQSLKYVPTKIVNFIPSSSEEVVSILDFVTKETKKDIAILSKIPRNLREDDLPENVVLSSVTGTHPKIADKTLSFIFIGTKEDFFDIFEETDVTPKLEEDINDFANEFLQNALQHEGVLSQESKKEDLSFSETLEREHSKIKSIFSYISGIETEEPTSLVNYTDLHEEDVVLLKDGEFYAAIGHIKDNKYVQYIGMPELHNIPLSSLTAFSIELVTSPMIVRNIKNQQDRNDCCEHHRNMDGNAGVMEYFIQKALDDSSDDSTENVKALLDVISKPEFRNVLDNHLLLKESANAAKH